MLHVTAIRPGCSLSLRVLRIFDRALRGFARLTTLSMTRCPDIFAERYPWRRGAATAFSSLGGPDALPRLEDLDLSCSGVTDAACVGCLLGMPALAVLRCAQSSRETFGRGLRVAAVYGQLRVLDLSGARGLGDAALAGDASMSTVEANLRKRLTLWLMQTSDVTPWAIDPRGGGMP